ncbi:hypothetical protein Anapl_17089 [Anas platyrhynchos]|uniref:Uncharacterized protein n=1 Tax=Anas platyrhynchos TaxID=8839 RepID=R0LFV9_ANAPL|nr:hypothetical protein Anapl_17089 [Anas platyrhynchos]
MKATEDHLENFAILLDSSGNQHNKPAITKVYGSLQSAQALLLPANILRKQHWLKIKSNKTLLIPMPSAFSVKTKLLQHPKEGRVCVQALAAGHGPPRTGASPADHKYRGTPQGDRSPGASPPGRFSFSGTKPALAFGGDPAPSGDLGGAAPGSARGKPDSQRFLTILPVAGTHDLDASFNLDFQLCLQNPL